METNKPHRIIKTAMKIIAVFTFITLLFACGASSNKPSSIVLLSDSTGNDTIFRNLITLTNNSIPEIDQHDSLAFLILPVEASCPSCREKVIDSIVKHRATLAGRHFIIISANGGRKTINSFFLEQEATLPVIENRLFLDSTNQSFQYDLYKEEPTIYYTYNRKAYKKVVIIPATVKEDLHVFFSNN